MYYLSLLEKNDLGKHGRVRCDGEKVESMAHHAHESHKGGQCFLSYNDKVLKSMTNYMYACAHCTEIIRASHCSQLNTSHLSVRRDEVSDGQWDVD